jgi:hypothetical protein
MRLFLMAGILLLAVHLVDAAETNRYTSTPRDEI